MDFDNSLAVTRTFADFKNFKQVYMTKYKKTYETLDTNNKNPNHPVVANSTLWLELPNQRL